MITSSISRDPVVICAAKRTPIGRFLGSLAGHTAVELGVTAVSAALAELPEPVEVDRLVFGSARQAGSGPNPARQVAIGAGLGNGCVSATLNMACASGLQSITEAANLLRLGEANVVVAGGMESMSRVPFLAENFRMGHRLGNHALVDGMYRDGFHCPLADQLMGATAETLAQQYGISRTEQDEFAKESQDRAVAARSAGRFSDELAPVPGNHKKAPEFALTEDEHPREGVQVSGLAKLIPVFDRDGSVTAGNSSGITDGAAALVLMRESYAKDRGIPILARWIASQSCGVDPKVMGIGPVPAVQALLAKTGRTLEELDLIELNEAFAAQVIACNRDLQMDPFRMNVNGGAIALGHPIGCTGARIVVTLLHEMKRREANTGLATLCVSGGMGAASLFETVS